MSIKSFFQTLILLLIILIIGGVYIKYFDNKNEIVEETNLTEIVNQNQIQDLEKKIQDLEIKNQELSKQISNTYNKKKLNIENTENKDLNENNLKISEAANSNNKKKLNIENTENKDLNENNLKISNAANANKKKLKNEKKKKEETIIKNLVKDVEYTSIDEKGNRFYLLANSGRSNENNKDILDLDNVRGKITSDERDTIYIVSDYAQYDTVNLNSKFYENVIINYQDKKINCLNFDINMDRNKAVAYNNVIISDPKSVMKAGIVEFDLKTKDIVINPEKVTENIKVITN